MRVGLIVNPYAGLGGPFAMRGSDGGLAEQALASGAEPMAHSRAARALAGFAGMPGVDVLAAGGAMGEQAVLAAGKVPMVVHRPAARPTAADTASAARALCSAGVDLLLFAGGDGTAGDLIGQTGDVPVLGVPAGVFMHSAVFATSPAAAAMMLRDLATGRPLVPRPAPVIDRGAGGAPVVRGLLPVPQGDRRQAAKAAGSVASDPDLGMACIQMAHELADCPLAIIGPGATMFAIKHALNGCGTLMGVDLYRQGRLVAADADEATIWRHLANAPEARLVLGVVGGQGFLIGRGNQQLSPRILRRIGLSRMTVLASADKLAGLASGRLLVDSGDEALDQDLAGEIAVRTGPRRRMVLPLEPA
jgi:predicted polyphosphate/ATP-dependent NAD kinase